GAPPRPGRPPARESRPLPVPSADPDDPVAVAVETLEHMLDLLGVDATVTPRPPETVGDGTVNAVLDIAGDDLNPLIGRRGETLASLQYLVNLMLNRRIKGHAAVGVDIDGYRRRREESLGSLARRMAERVISNGQSITLEPMPPNERRIIHLTLADHPDVITVSIGEGDSRKVAITPRR
ncbi:MAG: protein jag, partial [Dehalococcoidia bacterium]